NMRGADLTRATLISADLRKADLTKAWGSTPSNTVGHSSDGKLAIDYWDHKATPWRVTILNFANLSGADLAGSNLREADLRGANLNSANLTDTDLSGALVGHTVFANIDLRVEVGLEEVKHLGPSTIGLDTQLRSRKLPAAFVEGCGYSLSAR